MPRKKATKKAPPKAKKTPIKATKREPTPIKPGKYTHFGYQQATVIRKRGTPIPTGGSQDYQQRYDRYLLVRESQRLMRENGIYAGTINRSIEHILGTGFVLQARTGDKDLDAALETLFYDWSQSPEVRGLHSWQALEKAVLRNVLVDGDCGLVKLKDEGQLQLIESEQIGAFRQTSTKGGLLEDGVKLDENGKPESFLIGRYDEYGGATAISDMRPIEAGNFIFVANLERISQTRGMPAQVSNFAQYHRIQDILDSEATAIQMQARLSLIVTRENAAEQAFAMSLDDPDKTQANELPPRFEEYEAGTIFHGEPGEMAQPAQRNIPGRFFPATMDTFLKLLGIPVGLPFPLLTMDYSKINYSSARAAINQAYVSFQGWQRLLREQFHSKVYNWLIDRWIEEGLIEDSPTLRWHDWIAPRFLWLDPEKEAKALGTRIERGLGTLSQAGATVGIDREELLEQRTREIEEAIEKADEINARHPGANVDWRSLAGLAPLNAPGSAAPIELPEQEEPLPPPEPIPIDDIIQEQQ